MMSRGNRRAPIFSDDSDYALFLKYLLGVRERHPFKVHGICLMTNHFHLALETKDSEIASNGCILSEYPPSMMPRGYAFLERNRLIAARSDEICVVGGKTSGI